MSKIRLGKTEIITDKNAFGALPIQRISDDEAVKLLRLAYDNGITFFDTARDYTDSEHKLGLAFSHMRDKIIIATKTSSTTVEGFWKSLETSLGLLKTDYVDIYQFHNPAFVPKPNDGTGLYEAMLEAKAQGKVRFIGLTNHRLPVATEAVESGLYDTLQFPFSYLADQKDIDLVNLCKEKDMGFICMKALSGGLITHSAAAYAYLNQFSNVLPIWGIQRENELMEFVSYMDKEPTMDDEMKEFLAKERQELTGSFCRGCGYCLATCPQQIQINVCARMELLLKRAPTSGNLSEEGKARMEKAETCIECGLCTEKCPYNLDAPRLLRENIAFYKEFTKNL